MGQKTALVERSQSLEGQSLATSRGMKERLKTLICDESYEGAEALVEALKGMGPSDSARGAVLRRMFSERQLAGLVGGLEKKLEEACRRVGAYRRYMQGVEERLARCADIFGGRDSWGFANTVDHEDLRDQRNYLRDWSAHNRAVNAALMRLKALYRSVKYGGPWSGNSAEDGFLRRIDEMMGEAYRD